MTGTGPVVQVSRVSRWFGETTALDRVDLAVEAGTIHGLLGPNGAGKTTLLSVLFGLVIPHEGSVRLFGRTRGEAGAAWLSGVGGFIEAPRFYPYLSGRRNLATLAALDGGHAGGSIEELLDVVGLGHAADQKVKGYSVGMRQRLGLAAALLRRPRLLILDEPASGMDPAGIRDLRASLRHLARSGVTIVLASHDMAEVEDLCDEVTVLHDGRVAFSGSLERMRVNAPDPAWRMVTSDDATALALAGLMDDVKVTEWPDGGLTVVAGQDGLDRYVLDLARAGVAVRGLSVDVTPLEAMFFHLTEERRL